MAYFYIVLSACCSVLIAHLLKLTEVKNLRSLPTLTVNYLFASIVAFSIGEIRSGSLSISVQPWFILFCLVAGALFIGNFLMYSKSVHANGVGVTISAMRVSLLVPVLASIILYKENLGLITSAGIFLVIGALVLLIPRKKNIKIGKMNASWLLLFIFLVTGFADASLKIYQEEFSLQFNELIFMSFVFAAAFLIGIIAVLRKQGPAFTKKELIMGCLIGIPNLYSSIFLIYALTDINGAVAFPLVNALNVGGGTALGLWFWNDEVTGLQWLGIGIAVLAIILLL